MQICLEEQRQELGLNHLIPPPPAPTQGVLTFPASVYSSFTLFFFFSKNISVSLLPVFLRLPSLLSSFFLLRNCASDHVKQALGRHFRSELKHLRGLANSRVAASLHRQDLASTLISRPHPQRSSPFSYPCPNSRIAGVQCVTVPGYSKGFGYQTGQSFSGEFDHAWNAVYLEGRWHLLDSTWGSGLVDTTTSKFTFL